MVVTIIIPTTMAPIHVDEKAGSDATGKGTPDQPYETLTFALFTHQAEAPQYLIRKDSASTYEEPTQSALKKAKKGADGLEKKRKKAEEIAARDAQVNNEEKERREKLLADSKKIVLKEDESLPKATRVRARSLIYYLCFSFLVGEIGTLERFTIAPYPCIWMGAPPSLTKRTWFYCFKRRYRISSSRVIWASRKFVWHFNSTTSLTPSRRIRHTRL